MKRVEFIHCFLCVLVQGQKKNMKVRNVNKVFERADRNALVVPTVSSEVSDINKVRIAHVRMAVMLQTL